MLSLFMCRSAKRWLLDIGAMFFFWVWIRTTQGFSPVYVFFLRVWGGNLPSQEFLHLPQEWFGRVFLLCLSIWFVPISALRYDNCVVGLDFFLDCLQPTEFLVYRTITHGRLQPEEIAPRMWFASSTNSTFGTFFLCEIFRGRIGRKTSGCHAIFHWLSITFHLQNWNVTAVSKKRSGYRSRSNRLTSHVRAVWVSLGSWLESPGVRCWDCSPFFWRNLLSQLSQQNFQQPNWRQVDKFDNSFGHAERSRENHDVIILHFFKMWFSSISTISTCNILFHDIKHIYGQGEVNR